MTLEDEIREDINRAMTGTTAARFVAMTGTEVGMTTNDLAEMMLAWNDAIVGGLLKVARRLDELDTGA